MKVMRGLVIPKECTKWHNNRQQRMDIATYRLIQSRGQLSENCKGMAPFTRHLSCVPFTCHMSPVSGHLSIVICLTLPTFLAMSVKTGLTLKPLEALKPQRKKTSEKPLKKPK